MKSLMIAAVLALAAAAPPRALPLDDPEGNIVEELVVTAREAGPAWWRVSDADTTVYILALPETSEGPSYGTPGFRAGAKFLARLREDDVLVVRIGFDEREMLMEADPDAFFITDHYRAYPSMLVRLSRAHPGTVQRLLLQSWKQLATKRALKAYEDGQTA